MAHLPRLGRLSGALLMFTANAALHAAPPPSTQPVHVAASTPTRSVHPRVLLRPDDVPRLQARCGIRPLGGSPHDARSPVVFASHTEDFRKIQRWVDANLELPLEEGALYLPAFVHLVLGEPGRPDRYTRCIERQLNDRRTMVVDFDDAAAALDWCWAALDVATRQNIARRLVENMEPLQATDSPFEHYLFHPKLCHLAAAIALRGVWLADSPEDHRVQHVLDAAQAYFDKTLPQYLGPLHGQAPAASLQPDFEADAVFAVELWDAYTGGLYWPRVAADLHDAFDAYFYAQTDWPGFNAAFIHDFGTAAAEVPGTGSNALAACVAEVVARRTASPVAAWYARLAEKADSPERVRELNRRWLHILHDQPERPIADRLESPLARNLGNGWVLMRSDWRPGATVIAFDAGQPFWRGRQHYDVGQFQIVRKGRLALDSGDDVSAMAVAARGGAQGVGRSEGAFDDYAASTVAHNCVLLADPRIRQQRGGRDWPAPGNQRLIEGDFKPRDETSEASDRQTGRLLAFETNRYYSYVAADLARAYPEGSVLLFDRHLLFVAGRWLFVMDRIVAQRPETRATWLLHLPSRPRIGDADLDPQFRRRGVGNSAGTWLYPPFKDWVAADGGEGRLFVRTLLPEAPHVSFVGGPQTVARIPGGRYKGRSFVGSSESGFEYWLAPASASSGENAWYRLGRPDELGATFGVGAGWGRMEVEPADKATETVFVHLLVPQDRKSEAPAPVEPVAGAGGLTVVLSAGELTYTVSLSPRGPEAGRVVVRRGEKTEFEQKLSAQVQENAPIPGRRP